MTTSAARMARALGVWVLAAAPLMAAACGTSAPSPAGTASGESAPLDLSTTGTVTGRVVLEGTPPARQTIRVDGDKACAALVAGAERPAERYVVNDDGALANVFVYVKAGLEGRSFPVPSQPVVLDQQRCWYTPRVVGVRVGQPFQVINSDPLLHNVRAEAAVNQPFNQGQPVQGVRYSHTFSTDEVMVALSCDVHSWMNAWVGVMNHPYFAVTDASGAFSLPDLPAGTYTVEAWHEAAGTTTGAVAVTAQGTATLALSLPVPVP